MCFHEFNFIFAEEVAATKTSFPLDSYLEETSNIWRAVTNYKKLTRDLPLNLNPLFSILTWCLFCFSVAQVCCFLLACSGSNKLCMCGTHRFWKHCIFVAAFFTPRNSIYGKFKSSGQSFGIFVRTNSCPLVEVLEWMFYGLLGNIGQYWKAGNLGARDGGKIGENIDGSKSPFNTGISKVSGET